VVTTHTPKIATASGTASAMPATVQSARVEAEAGDRASPLAISIHSRKRSNGRSRAAAR